MSRFFDITYFECECQSEEHVFRLAFDPKEGDLYLSVYLHQHKSFWRRVVTGIKYIFGTSENFGHWDCVLLDRAEARKFRDLCDKAEALKDAWEVSSPDRYYRG